MLSYAARVSACLICRQVDLAPHEVLYSVTIPLNARHEYVQEFKQSPRREDDIAIVNAGKQASKQAARRCAS